MDPAAWPKPIWYLGEIRVRLWFLGNLGGTCSRVPLLGIALLCCRCEGMAAQPPNSSLTPRPATPLRQIMTIHHLTKEQSALNLPYDVTGVLTSFSGWRDFFFLQDRTGGISVNRDEHIPLHVGDRIRVQGTTTPGLFAGSLTSETVQVLGRAPMPHAPRFTFLELQGGMQDSQWISVHGIVQSAEVQNVWEHTVLVLKVDIGGGPINVRILNFAPDDAARLVDSTVTIRGVCGTAYNDKRQFTGLRLFADSLDNVTIDEPALLDPFALPARPIQTVLQFGPTARAGHRVKVEGVVTLQAPHTLYIQNGNDGMLLETLRSPNLPLGSKVEAVGFPALGSYSPVLHEATVRIVSRGDPLKPLILDSKELIRQNDTLRFVSSDSELVQLQGVLLRGDRQLDTDIWPFRFGNRTVVALQRTPNGVPRHAPIEPGAVVKITGILTVQVDDNRDPQSVVLLMRSADDLVIVKHAPWFVSKSAGTVLLLFLFSTLAAILWGIMLRRRVRQQTAELRESEERFRRQAQTDALTGLASRSFFHECLRAAVREADTTRSGIALLMVDLDFFKQVNDTLGHHAGDQLLCTVADRLRAAVRKNDIVARLGGDEFIVLLQPLEPTASLENLGSMVVRTVCTQAEIAGNPMQVSASVGICAYPAHAADAATLLQNVDAAMYRAKAAGRNSFAIFEPPTRLNRKTVPSNRPMVPSSRIPAAEAAASLASAASDARASIR